MSQNSQWRKNCDVVKGLGYEMGNAIGEGTYCKVYVAIKNQGTNKPHKVACKVINKKRAGQEYIHKFLLRELHIIRDLSHPHLVAVQEVVEFPDTVYMFMDYCSGGDLLDYIQKHGPLSEGRAKIVFKQIISAVKYLHNLDIAHRDLKCENVLLSGRNSIKIGDFGFSRTCTNKTGKPILSETFCGSAAYAAPEILQGTPYNPKMYDMWSLGCILFITVSGAMPFDDSNIKKMIKFQETRMIYVKIYYNLKVSDALRKLIFQLLEPDTTKRATMLQVLKCSWLRESRQHSKN